MTPDDPRHGARAGYIAGCRETCCSIPHGRYQKRSRLRLLREGSQIIPATATIERAAWWAARGVSINALCDAAQLGYGTLAEMVAGERDVCLRSTERGILGVTWNDLDDRALCYSGMTQRRLYSLMASGHTLAWITERVGDGLPISGRWRVQARVTLSLARKVAELSAAAPPLGPSVITATKARNRGHLPIAAWEDPGDPAMPLKWKPAKVADVGIRKRFDEVVVERLLAGERIPSSPAEKEEAMRRRLADGGSQRAFCATHGWAENRYVERKAGAA